MTDLVYIRQGLFTAFIPETKAGEEAFRQICAAQGDHTGKILTAHVESTLAQLRKAGYSVKKAKRVTLPTIDDDELLKELGL